MRRRKLHSVWPDHAGTGTRRLRRPLAGVGAGRARNSGDPFIRLAGATRAMVARIGVGRARGLLRAYGTWTWLRPGRDGNACQTRGGSLHFEWQQMLDR